MERRLTGRNHRAYERPALFNRPQASFELGAKEVPDVDHFRPDLQIHAHIGGAGDPRQADRVIEQGFRSSHLNQ